MDEAIIMYEMLDAVFFANNGNEDFLTTWYLSSSNRAKTFWMLLLRVVREVYWRPTRVEDRQWLVKYHDNTFFDLFRLKKATFEKLVHVIMENDTHLLLKKKYRGGHYPVLPEKSILVFVYYMATQDSLIYIGDRFCMSASTVMKIVNVVLYLIMNLKHRYIRWPSTEEEFLTIRNGFAHYPGVIGAVDGTHCKLKVPVEQHDSYVDRYLTHSINIMAICTAKTILTYAFVGYPGSAHDSRVFSNSTFVQNIERHGAEYYLPDEDCHLIGDSAFPIRPWLMTPYRRNANLGRREKRHNNILSSDRVVIENCFGIIKGRWRRLRFINTYCVSKSIEIATAACVLHNFAYLHNDEWDGELFREPRERLIIVNHDMEQTRLGRLKRDRIARLLEA